jgi:ribosomal protein S1
MSLRGHTVEQTATLPDGRSVVVHVGVPEDPYIPRGELETDDVELRSGGHVLAAVNTVLDPDQESEALELAREIARKLESGEIEPTAHAIEPYADTLR